VGSVGLGDLAENGFESVDVVEGGGAAAGDDAKGLGAEFFRLVGGGEEFFIGGGMGFRVGLVVGGLGAEFAVFGAAGGAGRGNGAEGDFGAAALDADFVGPVEQFVSFLRGEMD